MDAIKAEHMYTEIKKLQKREHQRSSLGSWVNYFIPHGQWEIVEWISLTHQLLHRMRHLLIQKHGMACGKQ